MRLISKKTLLPAAALAGATGALIFSFTPLEAQSGGATYGPR